MMSPLYYAGIPEPHDQAAWELYMNSPELRAKARAAMDEKNRQHNLDRHGRDSVDYCLDCGLLE